MHDHKVDRRRFLTLLAQGSLVAAAIAAVGQVVRFLAFQPPNSSSTVFSVGRADDYPLGELIYVAEARVYVGRDDGGLYAVDAVCPHLGCLVEREKKGGFVCPCHASRFDAEGRAVAGPATQPLQHLRLWLGQDQGQLFVDRAKGAEPTARLLL